MTTICVRTTACYRGLPVTVLGTTAGDALAVAAYGTPHELAIAAIAVKRRGGRRVFAIVGSGSWTADVAALARTAVALREQRDVDELGAGPAGG
jgi:hypothetical protein